MVIAFEKVTNRKNKNDEYYKVNVILNSKNVVKIFKSNFNFNVNH